MKKLSSITPIRGGPSCLVSNGMGGYDLARPQASHLCHDLALAFLCRAVRHPVRSAAGGDGRGLSVQRSEEHTSELQSLMRISYAVFCLKQKKQNKIYQPTNIYQLHSTNTHAQMYLIPTQ